MFGHRIIHLWETRGISHQKSHSVQFLLLAAVMTMLLSACDDMANQHRYEPLEASLFFADGRSARPQVEGTVPRGRLDQEESYYSGMAADGQILEEAPILITIEVMERGRERYDIYCSPCHGLDGYGEGMIVQRGFPQPQSFHIDRLRTAPDGYFYIVVTDGFGRMYPYSYRIQPEDRWAIVAYIRALQLSQYATEQDVPPEMRPELEGTSP
jgi:mono/diheme cytochrome c family protein